VLDDGQAEAGAPGGPGSRRVDPVEALEDPFQVPLGYPDALIRHADLGRVAADPPGGDVHPGLVRAVGDGVLQQVAQRGDQQVLVTKDGQAALTGGGELDAAGAGLHPAPVQGLGHHGIQLDRDRVGHRLGRLDPGQRDHVLDQVGQPGGLLPHPPGEAPHGVRVIGRVLDRLRQQRERADGGLELVAGVGHEVPPDLLHPAALGLVLNQQEHHPGVAGGGVQGGDPDRETGRPAVDAAGRDLHLAFPDLAVPADLARQGQQFLHHELVAGDQAEGPGGGAGLQHPVLAVEHHGRRGQDGEHG
jgi:hypothetical protein